MCCAPLPITDPESAFLLWTSGSEFPLHVDPFCSLVLQTRPPEEGPQEQRVPQLAVRGEPVHITGRVLQLPLHSSHLICASPHLASPRAAALKPRLSLTVSLHRPEIETSRSFFLRFLCGKTSPAPASLSLGSFFFGWLDWTRRCSAYLVALSVSSFPFCPHWLILCAVLHCSLSFRCVQ